MIDDLYRLALATLKRHLNAAGCGHTDDDGDLLVNGHRLGLSIVFDGFATQGLQVIAPVDVQIHLDGDEGDRFRIGALGVGLTQQQALQSAVEEWYLLAATPLLAALGAELGKTRRPKTPPQLAGWDLFAGRAGIRGKLPGGLQPESPFFGSMLRGMHKVVSGWDAPPGLTLHSICVMVAHHESLEVQAAVDGLVHEDLNRTLQGLNWPAAEQAYVYKQLFVLRSGPPHG